MKVFRKTRRRSTNLATFVSFNRGQSTACLGGTPGMLNKKYIK